MNGPAEVRWMVNISLVAFLVSEPPSEEQSASDVADEETELAGENIKLHIDNSWAILGLSMLPNNSGVSHITFCCVCGSHITFH